LEKAEDAMRVLERQIHIDATPATVWQVLTDFGAYGEWNPFIPSIVGSTEVGTRLVVRIAPPGGRGMTLRPVVQSCEAGRHFGWLGRLGVRGIFDGAHEFIVEPTADGGCRFVQRETFRGVLVPLVGRVLARTADGFDAMNRALQQRAEQVTRADAVRS
jgi:hypothetical protein